MKNIRGLIKHFRRWPVCLSILLLLICSASAQNITRIEYFYDTDPGIGSGTSATGFVSSANVSAFTFSASIAALSSGFHTLYIRSKDANNKWSLTNNVPFIKYAAQTGPSAAASVNKMEYFIDADPGIGLATNVPVVASTNISGQVIPVPLASLAFGFHTIYVRTRDANNKWSLTNYGVFIKYQSQTGPSAAGNIDKMEYFVDADPGIGLATNVPLSAALDIPGQVVSVPLASYANGFHTIYFRTRDVNGKWSLTNNGVFIKYQSQTGPSAVGNIVKMEYFVDADPGIGSGTSITVTPALDISGQIVNVNISALANGFHTIYLRSKDANGKWSLTNYGSFIKYASQTGPAAAGKIIKMEYFVDADPGFGNGGNIPFTHSTNVSGLIANIDLTSVANGFHTMYIRSMDTSGKWSLTNYATFTGGQLQAPTATITVNGSATFCLGAGTYLSANYSASATYQWKRGGATIPGATNIIYTPTQTGSYTVVVTNAISSATSSAVSITVNPVPTATISANGTLTFCQGGSVMLSVNATANATYQWHINGSDIFGATTTSYTANQSGVFDVRVTSTNGCFTTSAHDTVVVNPLPGASITPGGNTTFCTGDSVTLYGNTGAGLTYHWSNNATTSSIKVFTQANYSLTVSNTYNCSSTAAAVAVTVLTAPTATITPNGPTTFCNGGNVVLAANTGIGLSYLWSGGATTSSITVTSTNTYYVTVSNAACSKVSSPVTVTVNSGPNVQVSATAATICQGRSDTLTASGATTYAWSPATTLNISTGATVIATPASSTTYTVTGTTSGCIGTASFTVNINANNTSVSTLTPTICTGSSAVLNASGALTYSWSPAGTLSASTGASVTATPLSQTTYIVTGTSGSCSSTASITINVSSTVTPSVTISTPQTTICAGASVTFTASPVNGGASPSYQWYKNGVLQLGNSGSFTTTALANNDSVWTIMTSNATCPLPATATSAKIRMTVNPVLVPTISIAASQNPVCVGDPITFTATISNGGASPVYVWKKNNVTVGGNSATYLLSVPANNDSVWCVLTSNALCAAPSSVTSSKIKVVVNQVSAPTITVNPSQNPICTGASITFDASITNGGSSPGFQWYKNGLTAGSNSSAYTDNAPANNDSVWCVLTSNATCASPLTATSNKVTITIAPTVTPSVIVTTPLTSVCTGASVTFTANPTNGGNAPTYQWFKNGISQPGNSDIYTSLVANNDSVWCIMTSGATCPVPTTATSSKIHMTVNVGVTPTISVSRSANPICAGASVTFTATITNGGANPVYQWMKNNLNVGSGAATYVTTNLANNDSVWCVLTSNAPCPSPASLASNKLRMTVNPILVPAISVSASQNPICTGASVTFTVSITNGGAGPAYQWYKNGAMVGTGLSTYQFTGFANNDSVWCVLTSNATCVSPATATSAKVIITITPTVAPSVTVSAGQNPICSGSSVTFTATPVNGGGSPSYQWYRNGTLQSGNTGSLSTSSVANGDSVWCIMTSNAQCPSPATATSAKVHMTVNPIVVPTIVVAASLNPLCAGDSVTFAANISNGGASPSFQWKRNNLNVGNGTAVYGTTALADNDSVWCVLTSNAPCPSTVSVTSNKVRAVVNPIVSPGISISASQNPICTGTNVIFTAVPVNGGTLPVYQWRKNGIVVGGNNTTYATTALANNDSVWCIITSNKTCVSPNTATSNKVVITITPTVIPSVTVSTSQTTICSGTTTTFTANPVNGGGGPAYAWYKSGVLQLGNTNTYINTSIANNDSVWCTMTSNAACPSPSLATSNKVNMTVNPVLVPSISITASQNPVCIGDSIVFTATITNGGSNPVFQWLKNNLTVGGSGSSYTLLAPANNDSVWSVLTSDALCAAPVAVTSSRVQVVVNPIVTPAVTVSASANPACDGSTVTFTATSTNGGSLPAYQWYKNGNAVSGTSTYSDNTLADYDSVWTVLTSNAGCTSSSVATSNNVIMTITPNVTPSVIVSASTSTVCLGHQVVFSGSPVNGGSSPTYQWYKNGVIQSGNSGSYADTNLAGSDSVWCIMTSNADCASPAAATGNAVSISVLQPAHYSFSSSICQGEYYAFNGTNLTTGGNYADTLTAANSCDSIITLTLTVHALPVAVVTKTGIDTLRTSAFTSYQWMRNNVPLQGDTSQMLIAQLNGSYSVLVRDGNGCSDTSVALNVTGVGIEEASVINLLIYPNPTENILHVRADHIPGVPKIELRDAIGRLLFQKVAIGNSVREQLDMTSLSKGIYLLIIRNDEGILITKRVFRE